MYKKRHFCASKEACFNSLPNCSTSESHCNEYPSLRDTQVKKKGDEASFEVYKLGFKALV